MANAVIIELGSDASATKVNPGDKSSAQKYEKFKEETPVELILCEDTPHCHQIFGFLPEAAIARRKRQEFIAAQT